MAIILEPHSVGDLLTEVTREHTRQGLPSSTLGRVIVGMRSGAIFQACERDVYFVLGVVEMLETLLVAVKEAETEEYGS
jgi:hypothetical protein